MLTVPLAAVQAFGMYSLLRGQGIIQDFSPISLLALILTMTAGTVVSVWLGELITQYGFSNGVSILIFTGIVARLPITLFQSATTIQTQDLMKTGIILIVSVLIVGLIVFMNEAVRRIPITVPFQSHFIPSICVAL